MSKQLLQRVRLDDTSAYIHLRSRLTERKNVDKSIGPRSPPSPLRVDFHGAWPSLVELER